MLCNHNVCLDGCENVGLIDMCDWQGLIGRLGINLKS